MGKIDSLLVLTEEILTGEHDGGCWREIAHAAWRDWSENSPPALRTLWVYERLYQKGPARFLFVERFEVPTDDDPTADVTTVEDSSLERLFVRVHTQYAAEAGIPCRARHLYRHLFVEAGANLTDDEMDLLEKTINDRAEEIDDPDGETRRLRALAALSASAESVAASCSK